MEGIVVVHREGDVLVPANDDALALFHKLAEGEDIVIEVEQHRNVGMERFYHSMEQFVADAKGLTKEEVHENILEYLGYCHIVERRGVKRVILHSTARHAMSQADYAQFVQKARRTFARYLGMSEDELSDEVCGNTGIPPMDMREPEEPHPSAAPVAQPTAAAEASEALASDQPAQYRPGIREPQANSGDAAPAAAAPLEPTIRPRTAAEQKTYAAQLIAWIPVASEDALADHLKDRHGRITAIRERFPEVGDRIDAALDGRR